MARWKNDLDTKDEIFRLKRDAVLRESGRLFNQRGFHNTSLNDVARHLDVSKGTLYNYVADKQEILFEFHNMALDLGDAAMDEADALDGSAADKLRLAIRQYIAAATEKLGGYGVIAEVGALKPDHRQEVIRRRDAYDRRFTDLVARGIADGSIRKVDPKMAVFTFMGALQTIPNWFSPEGRLNGAEVANRVTDLLMNGIARDAAAGGEG